MAQEYRRKTTSVSLVNYHFVWCPKYRRQVLAGLIQERLGALIRDMLAELNCQVLALEAMPDHVHLFVNAPPTLSPCQIVFLLKGRSARVLRQEFPPLRRLPSLWTRSYFVATAGNVSADTIRHYIEMQKQRERA
ncbi:MAG: IS200/IS605 family transposase [Chloroflexi bacterium]|nr:IS200/IS605 family transposase [Chloroflexota bacterium]